MKAVKQLAEYFLRKNALTAEQIRAYHADGVLGDLSLEYCLQHAKMDAAAEARVADIVHRMRGASAGQLRKVVNRIR